MKDILPEFEFCVVDLETTGYSPHSGAGITEIGAVRIEDGRINRTFREMVDPGHDIPPKITDLTGITNDDVRDADPVDEVLPRFLSFRDQSIFVAHNASFDLGFINHFSRKSLDDTHVDTVRMARELFDFDSNALTNLIKEFNLERENAHRALDDALATAELFLNMAEEITRPEDYLRCNLPRPIRERSSHDFDVSVDDRETIEDEEDARGFIHDLIIDTNKELGVNKWAKILTGSSGKKIKKYRDNPGYGRLNNRTQEQVKKLLNKMISGNELRRRGNHYPVLEPVMSETTNDPLDQPNGETRF